MAYNKDRFVIVDGVQMSRERAQRLGLVKEKKGSRSGGDASPPADRARTSGSARKGAPTTAKPSASAAGDTSGDSGSKE